MAGEEILFGLVESWCRYLKPGKYHQNIRIITKIEKLEKKILTLKHSFHDSSDDTLMVVGFEKRTCMAVLTPKKFKSINMPEDIYDILKKATD